MKFIEHNGNKYPEYQSTGNAARFIMPFAQEWCHGLGLDIGYGRDEWKFKDKNGLSSFGVDLKDGFDAMSLPDFDLAFYDLDYIFSSHCLEHLPDWVGALDHWGKRIREGGIIFLYLPDYSQSYWRPWHNRKHIHCLSPQILKDYFIDRGYKNVFHSGVDLNNSFSIIAEK